MAALKSIGKYLWKLLFVWIIGLVALAFDLLGVAERFMPGFEPPGWLLLAVFLISFLIANVKVYVDLDLENRHLKDTVSKLQRGGTAEVVLASKGSHFGDSGWRNDIHMPGMPVRFLIDLDARNLGSGTALVTAVRVAEIDVGTDLLNVDRRKVSWYRTGRPHAGRLALPYVLDPGQWDTDVACDVEVHLTQQNAKGLAARLGELMQYHIKLEYELEALDGTKTKRVLEVSGDFEEFKEKVIGNWKSKGLHELVSAATNVTSKE